MPRRNNRKHPRSEGYLGFNPEKYIGTGRNGKSTSRYIVRLEHGSAYDYKPSKDRHKAHSPNERKRRAMNDIRQMQRSAERVPRLTAEPYTAKPVSEPSCAGEVNPTLTKDTTQNNIFGGITTWLKRKLLPA